MNSTHPIPADDFDNGELFSADDDLTAYRKAERIAERKAEKLNERFEQLMKGL